MTISLSTKFYESTKWWTDPWYEKYCVWKASSICL